MILFYNLLWAYLFGFKNDPTGPLKARIHSTTLPFFSDVGRQLINQEGPKMRIPDFEKDFDDFFCGVYNLGISDFVAPNFAFKLEEDGVHWHTSGGSLYIAGHFKVQYTLWFIKMTKTGSIRGPASDLNMDLSANIININGKPQIKMGSCSANLNNIDLSFHGTGLIPWMIDQFSDYADDAVKKVIRIQACEIAQKAVEIEVNEKIMKTPSHIKLPAEYAVDYTLEENPLFTKDFIDSDINALVLHEGTSCVEKGRRGDWTDAGASPRMLTVWVGEDMTNCFARSAHDSGTIQYLITKEYEKAKDYLRTTCPILSICAGKFFSDLPIKYPNEYIDVWVHSYKISPQTKFDRNGIWIKGIFAANVCINQKCQEGDILARIVFDVSCYFHPQIKDDKFTGYVSDLTLSAKEEFSSIGHIPKEFLDLLSGKMFIKTVEERINTILEKGLPMITIHFMKITIGTTSEVDVLDGVVRWNLDFAKMS